jgi:hypothetical protein
MDDRLTAVRLRIERDFAEPRLEFPGLAFRSARGWRRAHPFPPELGPAPDDRATDLVCVSGGHAFSVDGELGEEELAVFVAGTVQDDAMDQVWTPWPAVELPDGRTAVLEPRLSPSGIGVWTTAAGYSCPIGTLLATFGHLIDGRPPTTNHTITG